LVRALHWTVAAACLIDLLWLDDGRWVHRWLGYYVAGAVVVRIGWGFVGPRHARFRDFVPRPTEVLAYVRAFARGEEARHLGHNPLGALMILFFLVLLLALCLFGWLQETDRFFGIGWVEETHALLADALLVAVLLHVAGALLTSARHRENLVWAMITGTKRPLGAGRSIAVSGPPIAASGPMPDQLGRKG
jgi:cytochrome b